MAENLWPCSEGLSAHRTQMNLEFAAEGEINSKSVKKETRFPYAGLVF